LRLLEERRLDPHRPSDRDDAQMSEWKESTTDPDATPMRTGARTTLGYHDHYVVDGGKRRIILAAFLTPDDVTDNVPMRDLLWRVCFRRKNWLLHVTGDAKYGTTENVVAIENAGIRVDVPIPDFEHRTDFYGRDAFTYDTERDEYWCPEGQPLPRYRAKYTGEVIVYRADAALCNACPAKAAYTDAERGRTIQRSFYTPDLEKVPGYHATEASKRAMRKRKVWVEPLFAEEDLARPTPAAVAGTGQRQHPRLVDRRGTESKALPGRDGVGPAPCSMWQSCSPPAGAMAAGGCLRSIPYPVRSRSDPLRQ
jgi:Transposase DDE domain